MSREHDRRYGHRHRRLRATFRALVESGAVSCARCGKPIRPGEAWDLGHVDGDSPTAYTGPEHARCNRSTSGRKSESRDATVKALMPYNLPEAEVPPDDPERGIFYGPGGRPWSKAWYEWRGTADEA